MFVSIRKRFRKGDKGWDDYLGYVDLPPLSEVRTIDSGLNQYPEDSGYIECTPETLAAALEELPTPDPRNEYCLLAVNLTTESSAVVPDEWKLLGHDLTDGTHTSSLLNCGPWEGQLKPFMDRLNDVGLLSRADAELAQKLLPKEFGEWDHHAHTDVWALYERKQPASG